MKLTNSVRSVQLRQQDKPMAFEAWLKAIPLVKNDDGEFTASVTLNLPSREWAYLVEAALINKVTIADAIAFALVEKEALIKWSNEQFSMDEEARDPGVLTFQ